MGTRTVHQFTIAAALLATAAFHAHGQQVVTLDEGSYRLIENGREVGTETFAISQRGTGDGTTIIARGRVTPGPSGRGETELQVQTAGTGLRPALYSITVTGGDDRTIRGQLEGRRMSATIESAAGQNLREYLVSEGAIVAEPMVAHHHYFVVARAARGGNRLPLIIPSENRQVFATVEIGSSESIRVAGQTVEARRVTVQPEGGDERVVWVDSENRVLRFEVPSRNFVAERTAAPS